MVGLVTQAGEAQTAAPQAAAPQAAAPQAAEGQPEGAAPSSEEQESYDAALKMASEMLYTDDTSSEKFMAMLAEGEPAQAVATVVTSIIDMIEDAFQGQLPETVIIPAADEISDMVLEMGEESGVLGEVTEEVAIAAKGAVVQILVDTYGADPNAFAEAVQGTTDAGMQQAQQAFGGG